MIFLGFWFIDSDTKKKRLHFDFHKASVKPLVLSFPTIFPIFSHDYTPLKPPCYSPGAGASGPPGITETSAAGPWEDGLKSLGFSSGYFHWDILVKKYRNTLDIHDDLIIIFNLHKTINLIISPKSLVAPPHQTRVSEKFVLRERPGKGNIAGKSMEISF